MDEIEKELVAPFLAKSPAKAAVDQMFLDSARTALASAGYSALEFLNANPRLSTTELASRLKGASGIGLTMAIYDEAKSAGALRATAKELLIRKILTAFPEGWPSRSSVHPVVKLGSWDHAIEKYAVDSRAGAYASQILQELAIDHAPPEGWKPEPSNDAVVDELFDRYWPMET